MILKANIKFNLTSDVFLHDNAYSVTEQDFTSHLARYMTSASYHMSDQMGSPICPLLATN